MRIFNKDHQEILNNLGLFSKKQVIQIALLSIIAPFVLYFWGAIAFVIPQESMPYMNAYLWIICSYILCNLLLVYHYFDYTNIVIIAKSKQEESKAFSDFLAVIKKKENRDSLKWKWKIILVSSVMPLYSVFNIISIKQDLFPGSSLVFMTVFSFLLLLFFKLMGLDVMSIVHNNKLEYRFKYSDNYAGVKYMYQFLNSALLVSASFLVFGILLAYTLFTAYSSIEENKIHLSFVYGVSSLYYILYGLTYLICTLFTYFRFQQNFNDAKKNYLAELAKKDSFENLFLHYTVSKKQISSLNDRIVQPIKVLVAPTIMAFTRSKVITIEDLNKIYMWIFS